MKMSEISYVNRTIDVDKRVDLGCKHCQGNYRKVRTGNARIFQCGVQLYDGGVFIHHLYTSDELKTVKMQVGHTLMMAGVGDKR